MKNAFRSLTLLSLFACGDDSLSPSARSCVHQHPASKAETQQALEGGSAISDCLADHGTDCDLDGVISAAASECVARAAGLMQGIADVRTSLIYATQDQRLAWSVQNTLEMEDGAGGPERSGSSITVDAKSGAVLEHGGWQQVP